MVDILVFLFFKKGERYGFKKRRMLFTSIASGSSGNCSYFGSGSTHILIDVGITCKRISDSLRELGVDMTEVKGIFITHEHIDHVKGLFIISKKYHIPIYATPETLTQIRIQDKKDEIDPELYHPIMADTWVHIDNVSVYPFCNTHDAAGPVSYRIECGSRAVAVSTDLGNFTSYTVKNLLGLDALILEANHDLRMLEVGPYPYSLKRRILSDYGHLSNVRCGELLCEIMNKRLCNVFLGHLSKENNIPELAYTTVQNVLRDSLAPQEWEQLHLMVANRDTVSELVTLDT